ncbi:ribosomal protein S19-domain-containing protein, partial [Flagelloscypha sp. PMI_526]
GPYFVAFPSLEAAIERNIPIKTQARNCTVLPNFVGAIFHIHNGKDYTAVKITNEMIGHKLGEFSHTKQKFRWYVSCPLTLSYSPLFLQGFVWQETMKLLRV